ncbi:MAG: hypothetical protein HZA90_09130 [Verrucomicrobia bacterium]|nr:hypothetical protein [Verrucomicrobiota bacterium]
MLTSIYFRFRRLQCCLWSLESDDSGTTVVNIGTLGNLCQLLSHPQHYTPSINSTHLKRNQFAFSVRFVFQEPISALLPLHPSHHAPSIRLVGNRKGDGLRAILGDSVVIVLFGVGKVSDGPRQWAT